MIEAFTKAWFANLHVMREKFTAKHPEDYKAVVRAVVEMLSRIDDRGEFLDPERIHEINDGDYQGTLLYVIGAQGYQPSTYWTAKVSYGSCSGCDTLQAISGFSDEKPNDDQVTQYMQLALHIVQGLRSIDGPEACPMAHLPLDIARCLGRRSMAPDAELCPKRSDCMRHLDTPQRAPGDPDTTPYDLWVCSDHRFAAHRRMPGAGEG